MTTVAAADAQAHFPELLERSHHGEQFIVLVKGRPFACLGPPPARHEASSGKSAVARARALRARLKHDPIPLKTDIEEGRL